MKKVLFLFSILFFCFRLPAAEIPDNSVIVCQNGLEMLDYDLEFIRHANKSIEISGCYTGGWIFKKLIATIETRMRERPDLQVYFMTLHTVFDKEDEKLMASFKKSHPNFHTVAPVEDFILYPEVGSTSLHVKMVVVDEKYFSTGGSNLDEVLCCDGTYPLPRNDKGGIVGHHIPAAQRDMDIVGCGEIAKTMRKHFYQLFALWEGYFETRKFFIKNPADFGDKTDYFPVEEKDKPTVSLYENSPKKRVNLPIRMVASGPYLNTSAIGKEYVKQAKEAKEELVIANLYIHPETYLLKSFMDASQRGVALTLITNGFYDDSPYFASLFGWLNRMNYVPLFYGRTFHFYEAMKAIKAKANKVKIFEYHIPDVLYHKKVMVIDKKRTIVGSFNLGIKSEKHDYEMVLVIDSPEIASDFLEVLEIDKSFSETISPCQARKWYFNPIRDFQAHGQEKFRGFY